ncbi:MAG: hypothetical protein R2831_05590 [Chitinophagaceae bacterium]
MKYLYYGWALIGLLSMLIISCDKNKNNNPYIYNELRDTIAPKIYMSVPVQNDYFQYGEDIHMVGNVVDYEVSNKGGQLKDFNITIYDWDPIEDTIKGVLYTKNFDVDKKEGYTFNEKFHMLFGAGTTFCKLKAITHDYSTRLDSSVVFFSINP